VSLFVTANLLLVSLGLAALGAAADQVTSPAARRAQIERVKDGLNSPDSTTRLVTLEQAVLTKDLTIRRVALSTAFASADADLRSLAVMAAVSSTASFVVSVVGTDRSEGSGERLLKILGSNIELRVQNFDRAAGTFQVTTAYSAPKAVTYLNGNTSPYARSGAVSGERLSFAFDIARVLPEVCTGVTTLQRGTTMLRGTMTCTGNETASYTVSIDILR